jgi:hypothetical protein
MKVRHVRPAALASTALALLLQPGTVRAQDVTGHVAMEAVASISFSSADGGDPFLMFDQTSTIGVGRGWDVIVRPWARRMPGGDWGAEMYQLQMRYTSSTRIPFRFDAGVISSPLGLATLELKPDLNPTIGAPFYYFVPLPPFDGNFDRVKIMSGGYPLGAILNASGTRWDVRGGVTDATPARARSVFSSTKAAAAPQFVVGGGVTPATGLRFGAGLALGRYRVDALAQKSLVIPENSYESGAGTTGVIPRGTPLPDETAGVFNIEGEYAIGYTRVSGEFVVDRFETLISPAVARGFNVVAVRTLSPRWFTAGRVVGASTPVLTGPTPVRRVGKSAEATIGYRLTPTITFRAAYQGSTSFTRPTWRHAVAVSTVWAQRWW